MKYLRTITLPVLVLLAVLLQHSYASAQGISQLQQFTSTTTPLSAITQTTFGKAIKITGLTAGQCLTLDSGSLLTASPCASLVLPYFASTTIGNGTAAGGLTVFGGATTTGNAYFASNVGIGSISPTNQLEVRLSGSSNTTINGGTVAITANNASTPILSVTGSNSADLLRITGPSSQPVLYALSSGNVGLGTTTPSQKLTIAGGNIWQTASTPTLVGSVIPTNVSRGLAVSGKFVYFPGNAGTAGLQVIDVSNPQSPIVVATVASTGQAPSGSTPAISGQYLFLLMNSTTNSVRIYDISAVQPRQVAIVNAGVVPLSVKVSGRYMYLDGGSAGLLIYDISDITAPKLISTTALPNVAGIHAMTLQGAYLYVGEATTTAAGAGLNIIDVSNPTAPSIVGTFAPQNQVSAISVVGRYAYLGETTTNTGLEVVDVSNPASPTSVATLAVGSVLTDSVDEFPIAGNYLYFAGSSNMQVIDISNPAVPSIIGSTFGSGARGMTMSGKYLYVGAADLRIYDISGAMLPSANIGSLEALDFKVVGDANIAKSINVQGGLSTGIQGIYSRGGLSVNIASTTALNQIAASFMGGNVGIGTTTPFSKLHVSSGAAATTTVSFGEVGNNTSHSCFNTKNTAGADISFYFIGVSMIVENNLCK